MNDLMLSRSIKRHDVSRVTVLLSKLFVTPPLYV